MAADAPTVNPLVAPAEVAPFILVSPSFKIGPTGTLVDLKCSANQIVHGVDQDSNDYETFCATYRAYGAAHQTLTITVLQSFEPTGPWHVLYPLRGTVADFELLPDDRIAAGPLNPKMTGKVRVPLMPFLDAAVNEASEIDVELAIQGTPAFVEV
jgi:hypothetical protein